MKGCTKTKIKILFSFLIIFLLISISGCQENKKNKNQIDKNQIFIENKYTAISAKEYQKNIEYQTFNNTTKIILKFFNNGDKISIRDTVDFIKYIKDEDKTRIIFWFSNNDNEIDDGSLVLEFKGNLTDEFKINDKVKIDVDIIHLNFTCNNSNTYDIEIIKQRWNDSNYWCSKFDAGENPYKPIDSDYIEKIHEHSYVLSDAGNKWNESLLLKTFDDNTSTFITTEKLINDSNWTEWIVFETLNKDECSKVRFLAYNTKNVEQPIMHCQVKINETFHNSSVVIYDTTNGSFQWSDASDYSYEDWCEASFTSTVVDKAMIRFKATKGNSVKPKLYEFKLI